MRGSDVSAHADHLPAIGADQPQSHPRLDRLYGDSQGDGQIQTGFVTVQDAIKCLRLLYRPREAVEQKSLPVRFEPLLN